MHFATWLDYELDYHETYRTSFLLFWLASISLLCVIIAVILASATEANYAGYRRQWAESRGVAWTPKNRRPEKLRDQLRECEVRGTS